ncbi:MAG TPA: DsrE family protein [Cytophagaceae bacterium]
MKTAIIILSDPKPGTEESLGRLFNALAAAYDFKQMGEQVSIYFQGTGTRWPEVINNESHPAYPLYKAVEDTIVGVSSGCAEVFGANPNGLDLIKDNIAPGTSGLPSLCHLMKSGSQILTF